MSRPVTLRIPEPTRRAIEAIVQRTRRDFSSVANEMLEEAVRMRRIPGISFADGPTGRRARIAGTGLDVFEVVATLRAGGGDLQALQESYPWLSEVQIRAALAYAEAWPEEIEERLGLEERWPDAEAVAGEYPFMAPGR